MTSPTGTAPNKRSLGAVLGVLASLVVIIGGVIGTLVTLRIVNPPVPPTPTTAPTATPNLTAFSDPSLSCLPDGTLDSADPWRIGANDNQNTTYTCVPLGTTGKFGVKITQRPHSPETSGLFLPLPRPGQPLTRNYSASVQIDFDVSDPPQSCAAELFHGYGIEICRSGVWALDKFISANGVGAILSHGTFTVSSANSYLVSLEVSNSKATILVGSQALPEVSLDPSTSSYDTSIGLMVDGADPLTTYTSPGDNPSNPGAAATFSNFTFQPSL